MSNRVYEVGRVANNGKFYTPKNFVGKFKNSDDVLINTAHKGLYGCRGLVESIYPDELEDIVIVSVEIMNTSKDYYEVY